MRQKQLEQLQLKQIILESMDNVILTFNSNTTFDIIPNGTGIVESYGDMKVFGNLDTPKL